MGGGVTRKFWNLDALKRHSYVLRGQFCLKCSLNQLSVSCLFMFVFENNGAGYQFQLQYTLFLYKYHKNSYEISEMSKSGFFLSRSHIELVGIRDFQAKQGESRRNRDGWTVWSLDILLYRSFATLKCEHNAIFLSNGLISVATWWLVVLTFFTLCDWLKKYVPGFRPIRRR